MHLEGAFFLGPVIIMHSSSSLSEEISIGLPAGSSMPPSVLLLLGWPRSRFSLPGASMTVLAVHKIPGFLQVRYITLQHTIDRRSVVQIKHDTEQWTELMTFNGAE